MMKKGHNFSSLAFIIISITLIVGCSSSETPKPRGYFRIDFPNKSYRLLDSIYPYKFMYPAYTKIVDDKSWNAEKYWINIDYPGYNARIHISYKDASGKLDSLFEDSRKLTYKHVLKADAINEKVFSNPKSRVYGIMYSIKGNAASSWQFMVTDSSKHFLRGALYFAVTPNKDSLAPAIDFIAEDMIHLIETLEWKDTNSK